MPKSTRKISDLKAAEVVTRLGLSRSYVSELLSGPKKPSLDLAIRIEREFGVPAAAWTERGSQDAAA